MTSLSLRYVSFIFTWKYKICTYRKVQTREQINLVSTAYALWDSEGKARVR